MTKKMQRQPQRQDIRQETVEWIADAAVDLYIEVLREIYETEGLRGVTFASESLVKLVAVTVQECQRTGQKEHMTTGVVAARICAEWAPKILKGIELSKAT